MGNFKKLGLFLGTLLLTFGLISIVSAQFPTKAPYSAVSRAFRFMQDVQMDKNLNVDGILTAGTLATPYDSTYTIAASGGDYTTIQAALTAHATANTIFLVYPDTYTDDTINFTANNQCIIGMGLTPQQVVTTANARIVDFGAHTGCRIENIKMMVTGATTAIDTITGSGSLVMRWCHVGMIANSTTGVQTSDQPSCIDTTGTVKMRRGNCCWG